VENSACYWYEIYEEDDLFWPYMNTQTPIGLL
jgi:hypothetical protein